MRWPSKTPAERFEEKYILEPNSGCWLWSGGLNEKGYGRLKFANGRSVYAHRFSFELKYGPIPESLCACHKCDTPSCVNPEHIFVGTRGDNNSDSKSKGRSAIGDKNGCVKLKEKDVKHIRFLMQLGLTQRDVASAYEVSQATIQHVSNHKSWSHI